VAEIKLSSTEAKVLKQVVFRNYFTELDPSYRKMADKEVILINKSIARNVEVGLQEVGEQKSCETIIKDNLKEYRGLIKAESSDLNPRFKEALNADTSRQAVAGGIPASIASNLSSQ